MGRVTLMLIFTTVLTACSDSPEPASRSASGPIREGAWAQGQPPGSPPESAEAGIRATPELGVMPAPVHRPKSVYATLLKPMIDAVALSEGMDPALVHAVISAESSYNPYAVSPKNAVGLMQLMPATAHRFGLLASHRTDPVRNVRAGIRYLKWLHRYFGHWTLAIAAYNAGEGAVLKYGRRIPPYRETQAYVRRVFGFYALYQQPQNRARPFNGSQAHTDAQRQAQRSGALALRDPRERSREPTPAGP